MFKRKEVDTYPYDIPLVENRTVTFYMQSNVVVRSNTQIPIQEIDWAISNLKTITFLPSDSLGKSVVIVCSQVISVIADSEIPVKEDDNVTG